MLDECSMMSAEVLDMVEEICRTIRKSNIVFGGIQVCTISLFLIFSIYYSFVLQVYDAIS